MPSPSTSKSILSLPFSSGLSQKEDPRWLAPGALLTGQNATHPKTNIVEKRAAFGQLPNQGIPPNPATGASEPFTRGRRLGVDGTKLLVVATDAWTDAAWTFDEQSGAFIFIDRVPEVYALPDRTVASYDDTIREMDMAVCNGYNVYVWLVSEGAGNNTGIVYYKVENSLTGESVLSPQVLDPSIQTSFFVTDPQVIDEVAPKCVALGTKVLIGLIAGNQTTGTLELRLYTLDCTQPWRGVSAAKALNNLQTPALTQRIGGWDLAPYPSGAVNEALIVYQLTGGSIIVSVVTAVSPPTVDTTVNIAGSDALYESDGAPPITAFGLDVSLNNAVIAYAWVTGALVTLRVSCLLYGISGAAVSSPPVNLLSVPGSINPNNLPPPYTLAVSFVTGGALQTNPVARVAFSPNQSEWAAAHPDGTVGATSAFIASWAVDLSHSGGAVIEQNQPRITGAVAVASRWLGNVNGIGYILGRLPSWEQGTYYLFADDAWQDFASPNDDSAAEASFFPLRLVAIFSPRLSSWIFENNVTAVGPIFSQLPAHQDQQQPHALPHIVANAAQPGASVYQSMVSVSSTSQSQNPTLITFDMASPIAYQNAVLGANTGFATGAPSLTDGVRVHEFAFPYFPSILGGLATGGGGQIAAGSYSYIAIYDWLDARGQLHRSARSGAFAAHINGAPASLAMVVTTMCFSGKEKSSVAASAHASPQSVGLLSIPATVRLFRTQNGGSIYYEVGSTPNVQGQPTVTILDVLTDAQIATNQLLYGDGLNSEAVGAILDNLCPPAFQCLIVHNNRFVGIDGTNVWATKELTSGEGAGFNELMAFSWDDGPGPIMAAASMDGKLVLWKSDRVGYVTGQGPADDGGQNDWSPVQSIVTDVGCINWRSLVVKPDGVYFDSHAGQRQLTRDLQVVPVPNVEDLMATNGVQTSAVVHPTQGRILITANTDDTSTPRVGVIIDRDYILDSWLTTLPHVGAVSAVVADAPTIGPTYHWLDASGIVWRESPLEYQDELASSVVYVPMQVETAWVKAAGIEGFARFRRLQVTWQNMDPHALSVYVAYDYSPTYWLMGTVTAAMMTAMPGAPLCQQLFALPRQRAESVRFKIVDAADAVTAPVTGQGPLLVSLGLEVSSYTNQRTNRLAPAQRS
jgi:hypothetical protein